MIPKIFIRSAGEGVLKIRELNRKNNRINAKAAREKHAIHRFVTSDERIGKEIEEMAIVLSALKRNIAELPDGPIKDQHIERYDAVQLRHQTLSQRWEPYTQEYIQALQQVIDRYEREVQVNEATIAEIKRQVIEMTGNENYFEGSGL